MFGFRDIFESNMRLIALKSHIDVRLI